MAHTAHIEFFVGGLWRVFDEGLKFGDRYEYALPFKFVDERTIEAMGVFRNHLQQCTLPLPHQWRAMRKAARELDLLVIRDRKAGAMRGIRTIK